jgi:hypothetical protein
MSGRIAGKQFTLTEVQRQSVYNCLAGFEDLNPACLRWSIPKRKRVKRWTPFQANEGLLLPANCLRASRADLQWE